MPFGEHIRHVREAIHESDRAFSLRQVAARVGIEPAYLSKIERGVFPPPSEDVIVKLASILGEDKDVLLAMAGKLSSDLQHIIRQRPRLFAELLRQLREVPDHAILRVVREVKDGQWQQRLGDMNMIELANDALFFEFPEVHENAACQVQFQRTLRIPDDNREYPLPPGLGRFPMQHVEDHASRLPAAWTERGGVLLPMYQAEALWISFSSGTGFRRGTSYPFAVKIAAGKINAVTGEPWCNGLVREPQDYLVVPDQPWLDGFCVQKGLIRQFVAMPLGQGYTAEEQISGTAEHGGLQIIVYPMKRERYEELLKRSAHFDEVDFSYSAASMCLSMEMGLAPGGLMRQEIYEDEYGYDAWDMTHSSRCFVHILNSAQWMAATGKPVPGEPPSASAYTDAGLPWFEYYDDKLSALLGAKNLAGLDSVAAKGVKLGAKPLPQNDAVTPNKIVTLGSGSAAVSEGKW